MLHAQLIASVSIPPHARINYKCYPKWNDGQSNLDIVWDGKVYTQPWQFSREVDSAKSTCQPNGCVMRLWCTESGAVGRYALSTPGSFALVEYCWLKNRNFSGMFALSAAAGDQPSTTNISETSDYGHGTVLVMGDTLYFYTYSHESGHMFPRLSTVSFDRYRSTSEPSDLIHWGLRGIPIINCDLLHFYNDMTPIYPSGRSAVTVSISAESEGSIMAIDAVISAIGGTASVVSLILATESIFDTVHSASREFISVPGFACGAFRGPSILCYMTRAKGNLTWENSYRRVFGADFHPLTGYPHFELSGPLWLYSELGTGPILATWGLGTALAINGVELFIVEIQESAYCASGGLVLVTYDVTTATPTRTGVSPEIGCAYKQRIPDSYPAEAGYAATAIKWMGPWEDKFTIFLSNSIEDHEYYGEDVIERGCQIGEYLYNGICVPCMEGRYCTGERILRCPDGKWSDPGAVSESDCYDCPVGYSCSFTKAPCPAGSYSGAGQSTCDRCGKGTWSGQAEGSCHPCPEGYRCVDGLKELCPSGTYAEANSTVCAFCPEHFACDRGVRVKCDLPLGEGAARCEACSAQLAWFHGSCVSCSKLPTGFTCLEYHGISRVVPAPGKGHSASIVVSVVVACAVVLIIMTIIGLVTITKKINRTNE